MWQDGKYIKVVCENMEIAALLSGVVVSQVPTLQTLLINQLPKGLVGYSGTVHGAVAGAGLQLACDTKKSTGMAIAQAGALGAAGFYAGGMIPFGKIPVIGSLF